MRARRWPLLLALLLLLPLAAYAVFWFVAAGRVRDGVDAWIAEQAGRGVAVNHAGLRVDGFPFWMRLRARDVSLAREDGLTLGTDGLLIETRPWDFARYAFKLEENQRLSWDDRGGRQPGSLTAREAVGRFALAEGRFQGGEATFSELKLLRDQPEALGSLDRLAVGYQLPPQPPREGADPAFTVTLDGAGLLLPVEVPGLSRAVERVTAAATLKGVPPASLQREAVAAWSLDGGTVDVTNLAVAWGPLGLSGDGTLALDRELQPLAAATLKLVGAERLIDALAAGGAVRAKDAPLIKLGLGFLTKPEGPNNTPTVTAPLAVQNGAVFLGPVKLATMPRVEWPE
ncbi:MAG TPA: DUF2125 domain-containing protein [Alphaproteobacteria bacterium]|nr:DUF2125 domain-containing protein [Alphaproteobacteria bacterium]